MVFVKIFSIRLKIDPRFIGPYVVIGKLPHNNLRLQKPGGGGRARKVNVEAVRRTEQLSLELQRTRRLNIWDYISTQS